MNLSTHETFPSLSRLDVSPEVLGIYPHHRNGGVAFRRRRALECTTRSVNTPDCQNHNECLISGIGNEE